MRARRGVTGHALPAVADEPRTIDFFLLKRIEDRTLVSIYRSDLNDVADGEYCVTL